jgi:gluconokinase
MPWRGILSMCVLVDDCALRFADIAGRVEKTFGAGGTPAFQVVTESPSHRGLSMIDAPRAQPPVLVLMGVSGSGKSTVAGLLAGRLGWDLEEGDDLHPVANVDKMASGHPLDDEDRWPWLAKVAEWIAEHTDAGRPGVITCSALKKSYRDLLRGEHVVFVYLAGTREQIARRLAARHGHYMPASLLKSQFDALEPPTPDEDSITVDLSASSSIESDEIMCRLGLVPKAPTQIGGSSP